MAKDSPSEKGSRMNLTERIKQLRQLSEKATPGPWPNTYNTEEWFKWDRRVEYEKNYSQNIDFIQASRQAIPELCDVVDELVEVLTRYAGQSGIATPAREVLVKFGLGRYVGEEPPK